MNLAIPHKDLLTLRSLLHDQFIKYRDCPAAQRLEHRQVVEVQLEVLSRTIRKINRLIKQHHGHDCNAWLYPLEYFEAYEKSQAVEANKRKSNVGRT